MSFEDGMAALNLDMPPRVPRTEYSADTHWPLVEAITGIKIKTEDSAVKRREASKEFMKAWQYDLCWNVLVGTSYLGGKHSYMGHAVYAAEGADFNKNKSELFDDAEEALKFDPYESLPKINKDEMVKSFNENYKNVSGFYPDAVNMTGVYISCVSGLIELFGWNILLQAAGLNPKAFGEITNRYAKWMDAFFEALAESDAPVVMVHDDIVWTSGPFISPEWYRRYVFPHYARWFDMLNQSNKKILYTSDGTYTVFIDDIARCGAHGFVLEPTTDMAYVADRYGKTHSFIGNADTRVLLGGSKDDIFNEVKRCMDIGKKCPGFFMAVGNHIPVNTPLDNALYYNETYIKLSKR
ncbi:MAG: hypothetical protein FWE82_06660 [Defluviitaleaceae bacterium]|nr:hypothetical protein [Defluviitaleaceae bacterium]